MAGRITAALTMAVGGIAGYSSAAGKPIPVGMQAKYLAIASISAMALALSVGATMPSVAAATAATGVGWIVAGVTTGITYGTGYAAGEICHTADF